MGFIHAIIGNTEEAVDAFHKALGIRRDDTFSTTMLSYVIEQLAEDTPPFQGIVGVVLLTGGKVKYL
jgi:anaphase-promoting complex subunit 6